MMTKNKFTSYLKGMVMMTVLVGLLSSCNQEVEVDALFADSAAVRIDKKETELRSLLKSSPEGWKTTYFTDNELLGGYTFIFDFEDDKNVKMASDFDADTAPSTSEYDIIIGSTIKLSFSTKNSIHKLSDSNNFPDADLRGKGYKGDFEFLYYGQDGDDLVFKSNRDLIEVRFTKAEAKDWTELDTRRSMIPIIDGDPSKSVFRKLTVGDKSYNFNYNSARRFIKARNLTLDSDTDVSFGVGFTATGLSINPALNVNGKIVDELIYDADKDGFFAMDGATILSSVTYATEPVTPLLGYKKIGVRGTLRYNERASSSSSAAFLNFLTEFRTSLGTQGITFDRIYLRDLKKDTSYLQLYITVGGTAYRLWFDFTYEKKDDKFFMTMTGDTNAPASFQQIFKPITDILFTTVGHYVEDAGKLEIYPNNTLKLIPADNTTYSIHFYDF